MEIMFDLIGEESEEELNIDLSKFNQAVIWGTDWTTETISRQLEKGNIDLNPSFQRRDAWTDEEKSKLIESLMLGFPVPPIILAENKKKKNSYIVIDGKQRLLSIRRFYSKVSEKEFNEKKLQEKDAFKQLKLKGLEILKDFNGKTYNELEVESAEYIDNLDNQSIRTIVIKNWPDEAFLYTVFLRLNTGSKKLSPQELRQALKPGPFLDFLDNETANSSIIKKMLNNTDADPRMKDIELALRYYAFKCFSIKYKGNLKEFLDYTCEMLNKTWHDNENELRKMFKELENAIAFLIDLFAPNSAFSRYTSGKCNGRFNRSIYEILTYYFSLKSVREMIDEEKEEFVKRFIELNDEIEFVRAVNDTTKDINRVVVRFAKIANIIMDIANTRGNKMEMPIFNLNDGKIDVYIKEQ